MMTHQGQENSIVLELPMRISNERIWVVAGNGGEFVVAPEEMRWFAALGNGSEAEALGCTHVQTGRSLLRNKVAQRSTLGLMCLENLILLLALAPRA